MTKAASINFIPHLTLSKVGSTSIYFVIEAKVCTEFDCTQRTRMTGSEQYKTKINRCLHIPRNSLTACSPMPPAAPVMNTCKPSRPRNDIVEVNRTGSIDLPRRNCKVCKVKIKESSFEGTGHLVVGMKPFLIVQLLSAWSSLSHFLCNDCKQKTVKY